MAEKSLLTRLILRNDTLANWNANNPILKKGEAGVAVSTESINGKEVVCRRIKIGDGVSNWNALDFITYTKDEIDELAAGVSTIADGELAVGTGSGIESSGYKLGVDSYPTTVDGSAVVFAADEKKVATEKAAAQAIEVATKVTADAVVLGTGSSGVKSSGFTIGTSSDLLNGAAVETALADEKAVQDALQAGLAVSSTDAAKVVVVGGNKNHEVVASAVKIGGVASVLNAGADNTLATEKAVAATVTAAVPADMVEGDVVLAGASGSVKDSGYTLGGAALAASTSDKVLASEKAVEAAVNAAVGVAAADANKVVLVSGDNSVKASTVSVGGAVLPEPGVATASVLATEKAVADAIAAKISAADALHFAGAVNSADDLTAVAATAECGAAYKVATTGTYAGQTCEVGDMIIATRDASAENPLTDADWTVIQSNIDLFSGSTAGIGYVKGAGADSAHKVLHGGVDGGSWSGIATEDLDDSAVTTAKIADLNVTTDKLAADAVTNAKLADNAVQTENIVDAAVTTAKLADNAVTNAKIESVDTAKLYVAAGDVLVLGGGDSSDASFTAGSN